MARSASSGVPQIAAISTPASRKVRVTLLPVEYAASPGLEFLPNLVKVQEWRATRQHLLAQFPQALGEGRARGERWSVFV
jgi:hypothetical protein